MQRKISSASILAGLLLLTTLGTPASADFHAKNSTHTAALSEVALWAHTGMQGDSMTALIPAVGVCTNFTTGRFVAHSAVNRDSTFTVNLWSAPNCGTGTNPDGTPSVIVATIPPGMADTGEIAGNKNALGSLGARSMSNGT